jgi:oligosaccharide repeat unit polymerase
VAVLLAITMTFLLFISFILSKFILSPSNLVTISATFSSYLFLIFEDEWLIELSFGTYIILTTSIISIMLGSLMVTNLADRPKKVNVTENFSIMSAIIFFVINCFTLSLFLAQGVLILDFSNFKNLFESILMFKSARTNDPDFSIGNLNYLLNLNKAIGMIYIYILISYLFNNRNKKISTIFIFSLPVLTSLITSIFIGQRSYLLTIFVFIIFYVVDKNFDQISNLNLKNVIKIVTSSICFITIFLYSFVFLGNSFGKHVGDNLLSAIGLYASGGIASFNETYQYYINYGTFFGEYTLRFFYEVINILTNSNFPTTTLSGTFSNGTGLITNVYTQNLPYYVDFGFLGVILFNLLMGLFMGLLKFKSKGIKNTLIWKIMAYFFLYKLLFIFGAEKFYVSATVNAQYIIFFYIIIRFNLIGRRV